MTSEDFSVFAFAIINYLNFSSSPEVNHTESKLTVKGFQFISTLRVVKSATLTATQKLIFMISCKGHVRFTPVAEPF